ncbi:acyltransferase [Rhizobium sp. Root1220]|uniref:acyltransferase family protein n=1 Tax=Rhizobium sp. Root1220 TaxID=1736432 RepID=UPI0006F32D43|nr:acyltransferase [Rhizobium sp. Root1220]KQV83223.1 hypothetical protein ASC90_21765 [Rhizobium sp. Root1220]
MNGGDVGRISYLDALRGIAALQVLLLHFVTGYYPSIASHKSPMAFLYDGASAVFIFFTLSGYVLTAAFAKTEAPFVSQAVNRTLRLGIPVAASVAFSAVLFAVFAGYNVAAGEITGSAWLSTYWSPPIDRWFGRDAFDALFIGYGESSMFRWFGVSAANLPALPSAFNAPLWTLSVELYGSFLIFALNIAQRRNTRLWLVLLIALAVVLCRSPLICFLAGHLAARYRLAVIPASRIWPTLLIVVGVLSCLSSIYWHPEFLVRACAASSQIVLPCYGNPQSLQRIAGSIMITLGIMRSDGARALLGRGRIERLGALSFPIYLVHWPIVFGLSAFVTVLLAPIIGPTTATLSAVVLGVIATWLTASVFIEVDAVAKLAARATRSGKRRQKITAIASQGVQEESRRSSAGA